MHIGAVAVFWAFVDRDERYTVALSFEHDTERVACGHNSPASQPVVRKRDDVGHDKLELLEERSGCGKTKSLVKKLNLKDATERHYQEKYMALFV